MLRPATLEDMTRIFHCRNDPWIVSLSRSQRTVTWENHQTWFKQVLNNPECLLFIINYDDTIPIGIVRLDRIHPKEAEITIYILKSYTGKGIGPKAIVEASSLILNQWSVETVKAEILKRNFASVSAFKKAGFVLRDLDKDQIYEMFLSL